MLNKSGNTEHDQILPVRIDWSIRIVVDMMRIIRKSAGILSPTAQHKIAITLVVTNAAMITESGHNQIAVHNDQTMKTTACI